MGAGVLMAAWLTRVHLLDMEVVMVKLLLIPATLRWAHLLYECVILN